MENNDEELNSAIIEQPNDENDISGEFGIQNDDEEDSMPRRNDGLQESVTLINSQEFHRYPEHFFVGSAEMPAQDDYNDNNMFM